MMRVRSKTSFSGRSDHAAFVTGGWLGGWAMDGARLCARVSAPLKRARVIGREARPGANPAAPALETRRHCGLGDRPSSEVGGGKHEVGVDAMTGAMRQNSSVGSNVHRCLAAVHRPVRAFARCPGGSEDFSTEENAAAPSIGFQPIGAKPSPYQAPTKPSSARRFFQRPPQRPVCAARFGDHPLLCSRAPARR